MRRVDFREAHKGLPASKSWDISPIGRDDIREAVACKGKRNNRYIAEQLVGRVTRGRETSGSGLWSFFQ